MGPEDRPAIAGAAAGRELVAWGSPARFEIAVGWARDAEPREGAPAHGGWSMGEIRLTVGHQVLTRHVQAGREREAARWYLLPVFEWLAANWVSLLHEERFSWRENEAIPAAASVLVALDRWIGSADERGRAAYREAHAWWSRHALRASDPSALYPDLVMRRLGDDVELSWTARQPAHAPDGFRLELTPGAAVLPVAEVARPLWEALAWAAAPSLQLNGRDRRALAALETAIAGLSDLPTAALEAGYLRRDVLDLVRRVEGEFQLPPTSERLPGPPALARLDDAVLMFGGVSPHIARGDVATLAGMMSRQRGGAASPDLAKLVRTDIGLPLTAPYEEGYDLAEELLDEMDLPGDSSRVDVHAIVRKLGIEIVEASLQTSTVRGVALAGDAYAPAILVNLASQYNKSGSGKRFTLAHELFHILYDQRRARRVAHASGPWAPPGVEKRANAFAAMLLMPRALIRRLHRTSRWTARSVSDAAAAMDVGASALTEHLYNTTLIDEYERDGLRAAFSRGPPPPRPSSGLARRASPSRS